jgi:hypothetical protein
VHGFARVAGGIVAGRIHHKDGRTQGEAHSKPASKHPPVHEVSLTDCSEAGRMSLSGITPATTKGCVMEWNGFTYEMFQVGSDENQSKTWGFRIITYPETITFESREDECCFLEPVGLFRTEAECSEALQKRMDGCKVEA